MARTVRDSALGTRESRLKLKAGRRYWRAIHEGLALCYRRPTSGSGTWSVRLKLAGGSYSLQFLGLADDHTESDGQDVLNFGEAQKKASAREEQVKLDGGIIVRQATVAEAAERYLDWFRQHRKSVQETERAIRVHVIPALGHRPVSALRASEIRDWLNNLAAQRARVRTGRFEKAQQFKPAPKTPEEKRARRATANRILNVLKAVLNRAFQDGVASSDTEWRRVLPFERADEARIRFLTDAEAIRLVNSCPLDLRKLVRGALSTGARFGELARLRAQDVNLRTSQVYIAPSKSDRSRYVPLNPEGVGFFREMIAGKLGDALVFSHSDGRPWGKNHHVRLLQAACEKAKIVPPIAFHELRHTYASQLAQAGVELLTISKLIGHADTRITSKHYAHLRDKTLSDAVVKLPSLSADKRNLIEEVSSPRALRL